MLQMLFRLYPIICLARNSGGADCPCPVLLCFFINHEHFRASSNKLVHAAPQYLRYFLDGQHAGFYVTVFPAADILDPAIRWPRQAVPGSCLQPDGQPFIYLPFLSFLFAVRLFVPCCVGCCSHILLTFLTICHTPHIFKNFFMVQPPPSASAAAYYTPEFWPQ